MLKNPSRAKQTVGARSNLQEEEDGEKYHRKVHEIIRCRLGGIAATKFARAIGASSVGFLVPATVWHGNGELISVVRRE